MSCLRFKSSKIFWAGRRLREYFPINQQVKRKLGEISFAQAGTMQLLSKGLLARKVGSRKILSCCASIRNRSYSTKTLLDVGQPTPLSHPELMKEGEITPGITSSEYVSRREKLLELLPERSLAIIASAPIKMMTDVVPYPFRQDADYQYITGCIQPGGIAVLSREHGLCMFMPDPDPNDEAWQGQIAGVDAALDYFKADKAFPISKIQQILPEMIEGSSRLFHNVSTSSPQYANLQAFHIAASYDKVKDLSVYTHEMRLVKSASELKLMRQSAAIACQSLLQTMMLSKTCPDEGKLAAKVEYECKMRGAQRLAFTPVVGSGANASVIHYSRNDKKIREGELVLMDIGCEYHGYLSDLTRTWSPYGSFLPGQELLYDIILETNKECINLCKPGVSILELHNYSVQMLRRGLKDLGILRDQNSHLYHQLNPTSIGHYLGMDIHDSATTDYRRPLQPGIVITIEPGVYIHPSYDVPERFRGIGIRIEDEVLITESGVEVLTASIPKEISHMTSLLNLDDSFRNEGSNLGAAVLL